MTLTPPSAIHRGETCEWRVTVSDPDSDDLVVAWSLADKACVDAMAADFSAVPGDENVLKTPVTKRSPFCVRAVVRDRDGAEAWATAVGVPQNRPPTADVRLEVVPSRTTVAAAQSSRASLFPLNSPVRLRAVANDPDRDTVRLTWNVMGPQNAVERGVCPSGGLDDDFCFEAIASGGYRAVLLTTDDEGAQTSVSTEFFVAPDGPPCLRRWSIPSGEVLITGGTGSAASGDPLEVLEVDDETHPFPYRIGKWQTLFAWTVIADGIATVDPLTTRSLMLRSDVLSRIDDPQRATQVFVRVSARDDDSASAAEPAEIEDACRGKTTCEWPVGTGCVHWFQWKVRLP